MGPVMKTASMKPEVTLLDNDELTGVEEETEVSRSCFFLKILKGYKVYFGDAVFGSV
jgi:hypothetical protein